MSLEDIQNSSRDDTSDFIQGQNIYPADEQKLQISDVEAKEEEFSQIKKKSDQENNFKQEKTVENKNEIGLQETQASEIDKDIYEEVLEKLDIKPKEKKQDIQEKSQTKMQIEKVIPQDFLKIQKLVNAGLINSLQGQNLKKQVLQKAFDSLVQTEKIKRNLLPALSQNKQINMSSNKNEVFEEFSKNNPDFFSSEGRKEVLDYLKSNEVIVGKDELNKISGIIRAVEKAAIERYLQKAAHEKTLRDSNETAKQRLTTNAQKSGLSGNLSRIFTREQIGKMSSAEFAKYESAIMEQLKKGLIR